MYSVERKKRLTDRAAEENKDRKGEEERWSDCDMKRFTRHR